MKKIFNTFFGLGIIILYVYMRALRERRTGEIFIPEFNILLFVLSLISITVTAFGLWVFIRGWHKKKIIKTTNQALPKNKMLAWLIIHFARLLIWILDRKDDVYVNIISILPKKLYFKLKRWVFIHYCNPENLEKEFYNLLGIFSTYIYFSVRVFLGLCFFLDTCVYNNFWLFPKFVILYMIPLTLLGLENVSYRITKKILIDTFTKYIVIIGSKDSDSKNKTGNQYHRKPDYIGKRAITQIEIHDYVVASMGYKYLGHIENFRTEEIIYRLIGSVLFFLGSFRLFMVHCKSLYITHYEMVLQIYDVVIQFFLELIKYIEIF